MKKVTYLLGAGASFYACPILAALNEKMISVAKMLIVLHQQLVPNNFRNREEFKKHDMFYWIWQMGYFGEKGKEYGTVDTYAKKLWLNGNYKELRDLKTSISLFFTIWEQMKASPENFKVEFDAIDKRLIALVAALTERGENNTKLKDNVHFVTWNYDLQIERAFRMFCAERTEWEDIAELLGYSSFSKTPLSVCHLNGYHAHYTVEIREADGSKTKKEMPITDRVEGETLKEVFESVMTFKDSITRESIDFTGHINYAWENDNAQSNNARERAKEIFRQTDELVVVGYSFPSFNSEVDRLLFNELSMERVKVIYQDPKATVERIKGLIDIPTDRIKPEPNTETIVNPY